ncbi:hypothetical protein A2U01_0096285, partial [Trifolium medium]|nr:hypothetical protein [Trifolium medium]
MTREERKACEPYKDSKLLYFYGIDPKQALELP